MKIKLKQKSKIVKSIIYVFMIILFAILVESVFFKYSQHSPSTLGHLVIFSCAGACYCVFKDNTDEEEWQKVALEKLDIFFSKNNHLEPKMVMVKEIANLKWSTLMGPCTWEKAQEILKKKNKGWRLPTEDEYRCHHLRPYDSEYWMADKSLFSNSFHKETFAGFGIKAYFHLVFEV